MAGLPGCLDGLRGSDQRGHQDHGHQQRDAKGGSEVHAGSEVSTQRMSAVLSAATVRDTRAACAARSDGLVSARQRAPRPRGSG
ncbi:hypothetical protein DF186_21090, partial [Enterococcus hirae]